MTPWATAAPCGRITGGVGAAKEKPRRKDGAVHQGRNHGRLLNNPWGTESSTPGGIAVTVPPGLPGFSHQALALLPRVCSSGREWMERYGEQPAAEASPDMDEAKSRGR